MRLKYFICLGGDTAAVINEILAKNLWSSGEDSKLRKKHGGLYAYVQSSLFNKNENERSKHC